MVSKVIAKECEECFRKPVPKGVTVGPTPPGFAKDIWRCYRIRRASKCKLHPTNDINLQMCFDAICLMVCGVEIESREQFQKCFDERCPVALKIEHAEFASEMGFNRYLDAQFEQLNLPLLQKNALIALKRRIQMEEQRLSRKLQW